MPLSIISDELTDDIVISDVLNGNKDQFRILIERYDKKIYIHIRCKYFFSGDEMDDIIQDTFIRTYKGLRTFKIGKKFYPWFVTIAENVCKDYLRKNAVRKKRLDDLYPEKVELINKNELSDEIIEIDRIKKALMSLPDPQREILKLRADGYSYTEISEKLNIPNGTVMSRLNRARKTMQEKLKRF